MNTKFLVINTNTYTYAEIDQAFLAVNHFFKHLKDSYKSTKNYRTEHYKSVIKLYLNKK
jgi:hypothetical protein